MAFDKIETKENVKNDEKSKYQSKNKTDLGENFIPPDGGWGWVVCLAAGFSNLVVFPPLQQFGLVFRERLIMLGFTNTQITTIINVNSALSACTGLLNGAMFRRFSFRQVALGAATLMCTGLLLTCVANSFITYILSFSVLFGIGLGTSISSTSLALNTYFKEQRRRATGFAWTITAIGPMVMPYVITGWMSIYGVQGTTLLLCGLVMHTFACALVYQPVAWHVKKQSSNVESEIVAPEYKCAFCKLGKRKNTAIFSSQYLYNVDDTETPGYEITDPGTPMLSRVNDGWYSKTVDQNYSSKWSLGSIKSRKLSRCISTTKDPISVEPLKESDEEKEFKETIPRRNTFSIERGNIKQDSIKPDLGAKYFEGRCTCQQEKQNMLLSKCVENPNEVATDEEDQEEAETKLSICQKIVVFFDLDLLRDLTFVNLMFGLTLAHIAELNFSILTPFILIDFGFKLEEAALAMSILGATDVVTRFTIPFCAEKIGWENKTFFLLGIIGISLGRLVLAHTRSYPIVLVVFAWIGACKALRTIFMVLVIPSHVPIERLPAASGLQLVFMGLLSFAAGPCIGWISDVTNYTVTLHCLNIAIYLTAVLWLSEKYYRSLKRRNVKS